MSGPARRFAIALLAAALIASLGPASASAALPRPQLAGADAAIVVDAADGHVLLERRPDERRSIASTTKMMTALLAAERARPRRTLVAADYDAAPIESQIGLRPGERMRVRDLLRALLLESANDAAVTLAEQLGGSRAAFVEAMNERAGALGLRNTRFANPIGLDDRDNFSTARDLATLARRLLASPRLAAIVDLPLARLPSGARPRTVVNRNRLVRTHTFVSGVKTGRTERAGYVLVGSARGRGAQVVSVVLGEPSEAARDADSLALLRWGIDQFRRVRAVRREQVLGRVPIRFRGDATAPLAAARAATVTVRRGERPATRVRAPEQLKGPLPAGRRVGSVEVLRRGRTVATVPLVTARAVPGADPLRVAGSIVGPGLTLVLALAIVGGAATLVLRRRPRRVRRRSGSSRP